MTNRSPLPNMPDGWSTENVKGSMHAYSYSYFRTDEVISSFQKAIRRGYKEEAIQWALEAYWTGSWNQSNIWNRVLVVSVEDVGLANPQAIIKAYQLRKENRPLSLVTAVSLLAESPKSRVNDWACCFLNKCKIDLKAEQAKDKDPEVLYYISSLVHSEEKITGKYKCAQYYIWEAFRTVMSNSPYYQTLEELGLSSNWRWQDKTFLIYIHLAHLWINDCLPTKIENIEENKSLEYLIEGYRKREGLVGVPDYALDKHTGKGRNMDRGMKHFIEEGSKINNEDKDYKELSDWYLEEFKKRL